MHAIGRVVIVGLLSGPLVLIAAGAAQPPIRWPDVPFVFFGCLVGMVFVVGLQLVRREPAHSRAVLRRFLPIAVWAAAAGVSGSVIASFRGGITPSSVFFMFIGAGLLVGLWLCRLLFRRKFAEDP